MSDYLAYQKFGYEIQYTATVLTVAVILTTQMKLKKTEIELAYKYSL